MHVRRIPAVPLASDHHARPLIGWRALSRMRRLALALTTATLATALASRPSQAQPPVAARLRLTRDTVLSGVRCGATGKASAALHPNGALDECPLAIDSVMAGHLLLRGTWIRLTPEGTLDGAWLPRDAMLQGLPCKGTGYKGWAVRFHPDGALSLCYLSREATIDALPCRPGAFVTELSGSTQVTLHPNGRLRGCRLARAVTYRGTALRSGARVLLDSIGTLEPGR